MAIIGGYTRDEVAEFWALVARGAKDECWPWMGVELGPQRRGWHDVRYSPKGQSMYAYRVAWEMTYGPIPEGLKACHTCDHPWCVNPAHIFIATQKENIQDSVRKGRHSSVISKSEKTRRLQGIFNQSEFTY